MELRTYVIEGARVTTLDEFYDEVERELLEGEAWGRNLDAFDDILDGGFGPLPSRFVLVWKDASLSRKNLSHAETAKELQRRLARCHSTARPGVQRDLAAAERGAGPTLFDWLVQIIREHENVEFELQN